MKHMLRMFSFHRQGNCDTGSLSDWQTGWQSQFVTEGALESKCPGSGFHALGQGTRIIDFHKHVQREYQAGLRIGWAWRRKGGSGKEKERACGKWGNLKIGRWQQSLEQVSARKIAFTFHQQHLRLIERDEIDLSKKVKPRFSFAIVFYNFLETLKKYSLRNEAGRM